MIMKKETRLVAGTWREAMAIAMIGWSEHNLYLEIYIYGRR